MNIMPELKTLKKGEFFKKHINAKKIYIRGDYDHSTKRYSCIAFEDINNEIFLSGKKAVFIDFEF